MKIICILKSVLLKINNYYAYIYLMFEVYNVNLIVTPHTAFDKILGNTTKIVYTAISIFLTFHTDGEITIKND